MSLDGLANVDWLMDETTSWERMGKISTDDNLDMDPFTYLNHRSF